MYLNEPKSAKLQKHSETGSRHILIPVMIFGRKWDERMETFEVTQETNGFWIMRARFPISTKP